MENQMENGEIREEIDPISAMVKHTQGQIEKVKVSLTLSSEDIEAMKEWETEDRQAVFEMNKRQCQTAETKVSAYVETLKIGVQAFQEVHGQDTKVTIATYAPPAEEKKKGKGKSMLMATVYMIIMGLSLLSLIGIDWITPVKTVACNLYGHVTGNPVTDSSVTSTFMAAKTSPPSKFNKWEDRGWFLFQVFVFLAMGKLLLMELKKHLKIFEAGFKGWKIRGEFRNTQTQKPPTKPNPPKSKETAPPPVDIPQEKPTPEPNPPTSKPPQIGSIPTEALEKELERRWGKKPE